MHILRGIVMSTNDYSRSGKIAVDLDGLQVQTLYSSPYLDPKGIGGFFGLPPVGASVLIASPEKGGSSSDYIYMTTVADPPYGNIRLKGNRIKVGSPNNTAIVGFGGIPDANINYKYTGSPTRYVMASRMGHKLVLEESVAEGIWVSRAGLYSAKGKRVELNDSKGNNYISVENEHGDKLKITSTDNDYLPNRALYIRTKGSHYIMSDNGAINITVQDGQELSLHNNSTGYNRKGFPGEAWSKRYGNVNLKSKIKDINITGEGKYSKVFINVPSKSSHVQINAGGNIKLFGENIQFKAENKIEMIADRILMESTTSIGLDSGKIHLNSGIARGLVIQKLTNDYGI